MTEGKEKLAGHLAISTMDVAAVFKCDRKRKKTEAKETKLGLRLDYPRRRIQMKKTMAIVLMALLVGSFLTAQAFAQQQQQQQQQQLQNAFRMSELLDKKVQTQQGQELGNLEDIVIDKKGQNAYLILSGSKLGKENQLIPVPMQAANPQVKQDAITVSLDQQKLREAPGFQEGNWSQFNQIENRTNAYFGQAGANQKKMQK